MRRPRMALESTQRSIISCPAGDTYMGIVESACHPIVHVFSCDPLPSSPRPASPFEPNPKSQVGSGGSPSSSFAPTSHALRLMETLAASTKACEPVLLVRAKKRAHTDSILMKPLYVFFLIGNSLLKKRQVPTLLVGADTCVHHPLCVHPLSQCI